MVGTRPRRSYAQDQQSGGTTELDQLLADRPGFNKPVSDCHPRLELRGLGCPDCEKRFSILLGVIAGNSSFTHRGPDVDQRQSGTAQAGLPCRPEDSPAGLGRLINADDNVAAIHDVPATMGLLLVVAPQPCKESGPAR